jgi:sugar-specific transcriptional regulator TrmB
MTPQQLQELGLSVQEAKIYLALIRLGKASASAIAAEAGVSYGTIYEQLAHLERKGLAQTVPEKTKKFVAGDPETLQTLIRDRTETLARLQDDVRELVSLYESNEEQPVLLAQGKVNFHKLKSQMTLHSRRDYSVRPLMDPSPVTIRHMHERLAAGVDYRVLYGPEVPPDRVAPYGRAGIPLRQLPIDHVIVAIHDDETLITLLKKNTTLLIRDKDFSDLLAWFVQQSTNATGHH